MLTFFALKCFFPKKTVNGHQFRENKVACECCNKKTMWFHVSSNNLVHVFATVTII